MKAKETSFKKCLLKKQGDKVIVDNKKAPFVNGADIIFKCGLPV